MMALKTVKLFFNRPFPSCFEPHYESEAKCKVFVMKSSFHSYANKTNFHMKRFALSLAFIVRFTAIRKWSIVQMQFLYETFVVIQKNIKLCEGTYFLIEKRVANKINKKIITISIALIPYSPLALNNKITLKRQS